MKAYKPDQGRMTRMASFWSLVLLLLFGCYFLHGIFLSYGALKDPIGGISIPIVSIPLSGSFLICSLLFLGGMVALFGWMQRPKVADFLIDVEAELRKVTWPTGQEVVNASIVVVITVVVLMGFLAGSDFLIGQVVKRLIFGGGV